MEKINRERKLFMTALAVMTVISLCAVSAASLQSAAEADDKIEFELDNVFGLSYAAPMRILSTDDGYAIAGRVSISNYGQGIFADVDGTDSDYGFVLILDKAGQIQWLNVEESIGRHYFSSIKQTQDSGFVAAGSWHGNDGILFKYDQNGEIEWINESINNGQEMSFRDVLVVDDGYIVSTSMGLTGTHAFLIKFDLDGELEWIKEVDEYILTNLANMAFVGDRLISIGSFSDVLHILDKGAMVCCFDQDGELEWIKEFDGLTFRDIATDGERIFVVGYKNNYGILLVLDSDGEVLESIEYRYEGEETLFYAVTYFENCIIAGGEVGIDVWEEECALLVAFDVTGDVLWEMIFGDGSMIGAVDATADGFAACVEYWEEIDELPSPDDNFACIASFTLSTSADQEASGGFCCLLIIIFILSLILTVIGVRIAFSATVPGIIFTLFFAAITIWIATKLLV